MGQLPGRSMGDKQASGLLVPVGQKMLQLGVSSWVLRGIYTQQLLSPARGTLWGMRTMASSWCLSSQWISRGPASVPRLFYTFVMLFPAPRVLAHPQDTGHPGCSFLAWHTFLPLKDPLTPLLTNGLADASFGLCSYQQSVAPPGFLSFLVCVRNSSKAEQHYSSWGPQLLDQSRPDGDAGKHGGQWQDQDGHRPTGP